MFRVFSSTNGREKILIEISWSTVQIVLRKNVNHGEFENGIRVLFWLFDPSQIAFEKSKNDQNQRNQSCRVLYRLPRYHRGTVPHTTVPSRVRRRDTIDSARKIDRFEPLLRKPKKKFDRARVIFSLRPTQTRLGTVERPPAACEFRFLSKSRRSVEENAPGPPTVHAQYVVSRVFFYRVTS